MLCKYDKIIKDKLEKNIIKRINKNSKEGERKHYIPHHTVFTPAKDNTKVCTKYNENKLKPERVSVQRASYS